MSHQYRRLPSHVSTALSAGDEVALAQSVEIGVLARERLESECLSAIEEDELRQLALEGDASFHRFVKANIGLVVAIARKYASRVPRDQLDDVIQAGNVAIMHAVERFDYTQGFKFSTYASWWVRKAIDDELMNQRLIRIGHHINVRMNQIARVGSALQVELGRDPSEAELSSEVGLSLRQISDVRRLTREPVSLNQTVGDTGDLELGATLPDPNHVDPTERLRELERVRLVEQALGRLSSLEAGVLKLRFGLIDTMTHTQVDTANAMGIGIDLERKVEKVALTKLRHPSRSAALVGIS